MYRKTKKSLWSIDRRHSVLYLCLRSEKCRPRKGPRRGYIACVSTHRESRMSSTSSSLTQYGLQKPSGILLLSQAPGTQALRASTHMHRRYNAVIQIYAMLSLLYFSNYHRV